MLDCSNHIRQQYLSILNGYITFNNVNIPVYGQIPFVTTPKRYVIISDIAEQSDNNNHQFNNNVDVNIEIYCEQYKINDLSECDTITSSILNILFPSPSLINIGDSYFNIYPIQRTSSRYLPLINGDNYVARKIITISNLVTQK